MEQNKIDLFIATMGNRFPSFKLLMVAEMLKKIDDSKMVLIQSMQYKDPTLFLVVSILIGHFGVDRFMLGQTGLGVAKLLTCGGLGIWTIVDWFLIMNETREMNFQMFNQVIHGSGAYQYQ